MKKTYITPELVVMAIEVQDMIAASGLTGDKIIEVDNDDTLNDGWADSRQRRNVWDDEEDEEL